jgi:hypothetical protein
MTLLVLVCAVTLGCSARGDRVAFLESLFPRLVEAEFRGLWFDDECRFLAIHGRSFTNDPSLCTVGHDESMGPLGPFDDHATTQLDKLVAEFKQGGINVHGASVKPGGESGVGDGSFFVDGACDAYVYSPGWTLPNGSIDDPSAEAIDEDWYWSDFCS